MIEQEWKPRQIVLMRDGVWLVPPAERPRGWERYGVAEPKASAVEPAAVAGQAFASVCENSQVADLEQEQAENKCANSEIGLLAHSPEATPEAVAEVVAQVAADTQSDAARWRKRREMFIELARAVDSEAADNVTTDETLIYAAKVMLAGLFTRSIHRISAWVGNRPGLPMIMERLGNSSIWQISEGRICVVLGEDDTPEGRLEFWMNAMVAAGQICGRYSFGEDGQKVGMYYWNPAVKKAGRQPSADTLRFRSQGTTARKT